MSIMLDVRDLLGSPGDSRRVVVAEPVAGLELPLARVPADRAIEARLLLENVVEGLLVSGPVRGVMVVDCARCLKPVEWPFHMDVRELFIPRAVEGLDAYLLADGEVDLEPMIRDAVVLAMPYSPLCRADCLGLCPRCGSDRNEGPCDCGPEIDDRWSALSVLTLPEPLREPTLESPPN
ncbi:MAG: DUF177 domain-containing protein [Actinobacteria bacterium]|nr:DUF177 domain-containing protein [Actinomycetota bacterium]